MENKGYSSVQRTGQKEFDSGLQKHMQRVYNIMALGLVVTAISAYVVSTQDAIVIPLLKSMSNPFLGLLIGISPFLLLSFLLSPSRMRTLSMTAMTATFVGISAYWGVIFSIFFYVYDPSSIVKTFFVTSATFAVMSIWGYTTKRDLTSMGSFLVMGAFGLFIAIVINYFLQSPMMHMIISGVGVIVYTLMTAWDTQKIKESYAYSHGSDANNRLAMWGAIQLYINFIMLFQFLLQFMGGRE